MVNNKEIYKGIDLFKLIASILIVILHCLGNTLGDQGVTFTRNVSSMAVPFFFVVSGYFFAEKYWEVQDKKQFVLRYSIRLFKLYLVWAAVYLILKLPNYIFLYGNNIFYLIGYLVRKICFVGLGVYWYFLALAETVLMLYFFVSRNKEKHMYACAVILYIIGVLFAGFRPAFSNSIVLSSFFKMIYCLFSWTNNALFLGLPCVSIGWALSKYKIRFSFRTSVILFILSMLLKYSEYFLNEYLIEQDCEFSAFQILTGTCFFLVAISLNPGYSPKTSVIIREISTTIFLLHSIFLFFIDDTQQKNGVIDFIIVVFLCLIAKLIIDKLRCSFIDYLFMRKT